MKVQGVNEIRTRFLDFFEERGHIRLKSFSLVPESDPSLFLINAGMAPLKPYFLGEKKMQRDRATSSQRCVRTADIDQVGKTARHGTFFEMLGNFSFGDYFKREAISWAWSFLTDELGLEKERLWISVYEEDEEAYKIWTEEVGIPAERMMRLGKEDNFWELDQGPCGPCSEIHYDRHPELGPQSPSENSDRFMEVWNLVFTQFDKQADGSYAPLEHKNIDTGMGLERIAMVCENADNIFELQAFLPIREEIEHLGKTKYGANAKSDESIRVILDHTKALTFLVYDGIVPSNEGRGYVLRRLLRRAYRHGKLLGIEGEFLSSIIDRVIEVYQGEYNDLIDARERILRVVKREEENFQQTIDQGLALLEELMQEKEAQNLKILDGASVFKLYDTYGFPMDLTKEIALERGFTVDETHFYEEMEKQRTLSREKRKGGVGWKETRKLDLSELEPTTFTGYDVLKDESTLRAIFVGDDRCDEVSENEAILILDQTPFYAEGGGQVSDLGTLQGPDGHAKVTYVEKTKEGIYLHHVEMTGGSLHEGDQLSLSVSMERRGDIMRNHSATHLLHKALSMVLGDHVKQAGSYVDPQRLRFDFSHYDAMKPEQIREVEDIVNDAIFRSYPVLVEQLHYEEAMEQGAVGLFEDKYHDVVRVISMGAFSKELCGGTHVENTAQVQMFKILSEQGVSSGVRRIEAITGRNCYQRLQNFETERKELASRLKTTPQTLLERVDQMKEEEKELRRELRSYQDKAAGEASKQLQNAAQEIQGITVIAQSVGNVPMDGLKNMVDALKEKTPKAVIVLSACTEEKVLFACAVDAALLPMGMHAGKIIKEVAQKTGGNGGGRPEFATAGGKDPAKVEEALQSVPAIVESLLK